MKAPDPAAPVVEAVTPARAVQLARRGLLIRVGWFVLLVACTIWPIWLDRHAVISNGLAAALWVGATALLGGMALRWHVLARRRLAATPVVDQLGRHVGAADGVAKAESDRVWGAARYGFIATYIVSLALGIATPGPQLPIWALLLSLTVGVATWQRNRTVRRREASTPNGTAIWGPTAGR